MGVRNALVAPLLKVARNIFVAYASVSIHEFFAGKVTLKFLQRGALTGSRTEVQPKTEFLFISRARSQEIVLSVEQFKKSERSSS